MAVVKIIGVGNPLRGDDAVGLAIAEALRRRRLSGVDVSTAWGEGTILMESWRGAERVVLVDAVRSMGSPGAIHRLDASTAALPADFFRYSSHAFGVLEAIELARVLDELPPSLIIYGVEVASIQCGEGLSSAVTRAAAEVVERISNEILRTAPAGQ